MTLIVIAGNSKYMIQVMDRRLTASGEVIEEESCKGGVFQCNNARLNFAYTGLAKAGTFITRDWLLETLANSISTDFDAKNTLDQFVYLANKNYLPSIPEPIRYSSERRLIIVFSGYLYHHDPPMGAYAIIRNHSLVNNRIRFHDFKIGYLTETRPNDANWSLVLFLGSHTVVTHNDIEKLKSILRKDTDHKAITNLVVDRIRNIGRRPESSGTIGGQLLSTCIPIDPATGFICNYHSESVKHITYMPDWLLYKKNIGFTIKNISLEAVDPESTPPLTVPKVRRNNPCPCGSGKKYKRCHGLL